MMSKKAITTRTDHHYFGALVALTALAMVAVMLLTASRPSYATATFVVNSTADQADVNLGDGVCDSNPTAGTEVCTLRAAIQEANDRTDDLESIREPSRNALKKDASLREWACQNSHRSQRRCVL